jgi:[ribosomal protein S18]-alanine N-acetyltransferase
VTNPSEVAIRPITCADVDAVADLDATTSGLAHWQRDDYARAAEPGSAIQCRVAESGGKIIGFITARATLGETEILNIAVANTHRRKGVATKLVQDQLNVPGTTVVFLEVKESNSAARVFYERMDFRETGRRRAYYSNPTEDALLLRRDIGIGR